MVLVGVASLISAWLAHERSLVLKRKATLAFWDRWGITESAYDATPTSLVRQFFGDRAVAVIRVRIDQYDGRVAKEARQLFPEAHIETHDPFP